MSNVTLNLIVLRSADLDRAARFYGTLGLSFTRERHGSGPEHLACQVGSTIFEIYPRKDESDSTSPTRIGFRVLSVDAAVRQFQEIGVKEVSAPTNSPWGRRAVVEDFDGHRVELTE